MKLKLNRYDIVCDDYQVKSKNEFTTKKGKKMYSYDCESGDISFSVLSWKDNLPTKQELKLIGCDSYRGITNLKFWF